MNDARTSLLLFHFPISPRTCACRNAIPWSQCAHRFLLSPSIHASACRQFPACRALSIILSRAERVLAGALSLFTACVFSSRSPSCSAISFSFPSKKRSMAMVVSESCTASVETGQCLLPAICPCFRHSLTASAVRPFSSKIVAYSPLLTRFGPPSSKRRHAPSSALPNAPSNTHPMITSFSTVFHERPFSLAFFHAIPARSTEPTSRNITATSRQKSCPCFPVASPSMTISLPTTREASSTLPTFSSLFTSSMAFPIVLSTTPYLLAPSNKSRLISTSTASRNCNPLSPSRRKLLALSPCLTSVHNLCQKTHSSTKKPSISRKINYLQ